MPMSSDVDIYARRRTYSLEEAQRRILTQAKYTSSLLKNMPFTAEPPYPYMIVGPPGAGKSSIIRDLAEKVVQTTFGPMMSTINLLTMQSWRDLPQILYNYEKIYDAFAEYVKQRGYDLRALRSGAVEDAETILFQLWHDFARDLYDESRKDMFRKAGFSDEEIKTLKEIWKIPYIYITPNTVLPEDIYGIPYSKDAFDVILKRLLKRIEQDVASGDVEDENEIGKILVAMPVYFAVLSTVPSVMVVDDFLSIFSRNMNQSVRTAFRTILNPPGQRGGSVKVMEPLFVFLLSNTPDDYNILYSEVPPQITTRVKMLMVQPTIEDFKKYFLSDQYIHSVSDLIYNALTLLIRAANENAVSGVRPTISKAPPLSSIEATVRSVVAPMLSVIDELKLIQFQEPLIPVYPPGPAGSQITTGIHGLTPRMFDLMIRPIPLILLLHGFRSLADLFSVVFSCSGNNNLPACRLAVEARGQIYEFIATIVGTHYASLIMEKLAELLRDADFFSIINISLGLKPNATIDEMVEALREKGLEPDESGVRAALEKVRELYGDTSILPLFSVDLTINGVERVVDLVFSLATKVDYDEAVKIGAALLKYWVKLASKVASLLQVGSTKTVALHEKVIKENIESHLKLLKSQAPSEQYADVVRRLLSAFMYESTPDLLSRLRLVLGTYEAVQTEAGTSKLIPTQLIAIGGPVMDEIIEATKRDAEALNKASALLDIAKKVSDYAIEQVIESGGSIIDQPSVAQPSVASPTQGLPPSAVLNPEVQRELLRRQIRRF